jgi:predicted RNA-binding Zn-ribbon protein involved in translation (DUF1610 family)
MRLNEYSKHELKVMYERAVIDKCPVCGRYHQADKPDWPMANVYRCDKCQKEREVYEKHFK